MKKMKNEVKIGIFTLLMIIGAWAGLRFLSGIDLLGSNNNLYANYPEVSGIQPSSPILIYGVKVGSVSEVILNPTAKSLNDKVTLQLSVSNKYMIPKDSKAEIFSNGIMGGKAINIIMGESSDYLHSGESITGCHEYGLLDKAEGELSELKAMVESVTSELQLTLSTLNGIMTTNAKQIGGVVANMEQLTSNLNALIDSEQGDVTRMVSGLADLTQTLGDNAKSIDNIVGNLDSISSEFAEAELSNSINSTLNNLSSLTAKLNSDSGTIGKMMSDDSLYNNLNAALINLDSLLFDFKDRPDRYINVSVFGKDYDRKYAKAEKKRAKAEKNYSKK
ncbi:MAG: MlaD family protein [Rikenellaceae bacterium]